MATDPRSLPPTEHRAYEARLVAAVWTLSGGHPHYREKRIRAVGLRGEWPDTVVWFEWSGPLGEGSWAPNVYRQPPYELGALRDVDPETLAIDLLDAVMEN